MVSEARGETGGITARVWIYLIFLLSGFAALLYQNVWQRALYSIYGINVESVTGRGSLFMFSLGLERDQTPSHPTPVDSAMGVLDGGESLNGDVLIVEDNDVNRMIAREMLLSLGLHVVEATDGEKALEVLTNTEVDLIIMDCLMPVMDGYETARAIRTREAASGGRRTPIVALTANAFDEDAERSRAAGMDAHMAKPYTRAQLRELLRAWL